MKRFLKTLFGKPVYEVRTYRTKQAEDHRQKVREVVNQLNREMGRPEKFKGVKS